MTYTPDHAMIAAGDPVALQTAVIAGLTTIMEETKMNFAATALDHREGWVLAQDVCAAAKDPWPTDLGLHVLRWDSPERGICNIATVGAYVGGDALASSARVLSALLTLADEDREWASSEAGLHAALIHLLKVPHEVLRANASEAEAAKLVRSVQAKLGAVVVLF
jgi:hypothetical protein